MAFYFANEHKNPDWADDGKGRGGATQAVYGLRCGCTQCKEVLAGLRSN